MSERTAREFHITRSQERRDAALQALEDGESSKAIHEVGKMLKHDSHLYAEGTIKHEHMRAVGKALVSLARVLATGE